MRSWRRILIVAVATVLSSGCGQSLNPVKTATPGNGSDNSSNSQPAANADPNVIPNTETANVGAPLDKRFNRANRPLVDADSPATPLPLRFAPAGDNSQIAVTMKDDGSVFEVRVFKSQPVIARVEATWLEGNERELKYSLKNGKILVIKTDRIENLKTASLPVLLDIAGLKQAGKNK
ncbi:hypothetical protein BH10ACI2_BH10ACI2_21990 [soil metagenome]